MDIHEELLKSLVGKDDAIIKVLKKFNEDIYQLKKENVIMKRILKEMLHIPESIWKI